LWINHVGNCIRTKSPFADWSTDNCNRQNKKSAPAVIIETQKIIKVGLPTQSERSALPVKTLHTCQTCIYREASASLYHTTHLLILKRQAATYQLERGRRVAHLLERTICIGLSYLLTLYWQFMIRKFLLGFLPLEGFPG
jgi:hypothetical protein